MVHSFVCYNLADTPLFLKCVSNRAFHKLPLVETNSNQLKSCKKSSLYDVQSI